MDHIKINWLMEGVQTKLPINVFYQGDGYYILERSNLKKGEKVNFKMQYPESYFQNATKFDKVSRREIQPKDSSFSGWILLPILLPYLLIYALFDFLASLGYDYRRNRGFRSGTFRHYTRPRNTGGGGFGGSGGGGGCACACACACAGSGRAGCSQKDFYHTNLKYTKSNKK